MSTKERGAALLLALLAVLLLIALGAAAVLATRQGVAADPEAGERAARRAAEAGVAAALDALAASCDAQAGLSAAPPVPGSGARAGDPGALLDAALRATYTVSMDILGPQAARVRSLGLGPHGARIAVEARVDASSCQAIRVSGWRERP